MKNLTRFIESIGSANTSKNAITYISGEDGRVCAHTYSQLEADAKGFSMYLRSEYGQIQSMHIGLLGKSSYETIVAYFGIIISGGVAVLLNGQEQPESVLNQISLTETTLIISDGSFEKLWPNVIESTGLRVCHSAEVIGHDDKGFVEIEGESEDELVTMLFTSGTTSETKAVMISRDNIFACIEYYKEVLDLMKNHAKSDDFPAYLMVPFYHVAGFALVMIFLFAGENISFSTNPGNIFGEIKTLQPKYVSAPPTVIKLLHNQLKAGKKDRIGNLKAMICAGAALDGDFIDLFEQNGVTLYGTYGMTETVATGAFTNIDDTNFERRLKSVGVTRSQMSIKEIDGELCLKGRGLFKGYYNNQEATMSAIDEDGWFHSGDMGYIDSDGYVYITGRKKNLIILESGENVVPDELEVMIMKCQAVKECIVKEKDKKICAEIFAQGDESEVKDFITEINKQVAMYKRITLIEFRESPFEKTSLGKIKRK